MTSPHVHVLNDFSGVTVEQRERRSGKTHVTMTIKSEPIVIHTDPLALGKRGAEAIAHVIREGIRAIGTTASDATLMSRKAAQAAFARGETWATKRYSGGRTGAKAPFKSDKLFNDSGRLADGIAANVNNVEKGWTINAPVNRLDPTTFPSIEAFQRMIDQLFALVPVLRNPLAHPDVIEAMEKTWQEMHRKESMSTGERQAGLIARAAREGLRLARDVLG